jgi:uncharacterized membrane protein YbhN (UPF0104 family)
VPRTRTIAGAVLSVVGIVAVLYFYGDDLDQVDFSNADIWPRLVAASAIYVLNAALSGIAWRMILVALGQSPRPWDPVRHLMLSQVGKYVPGNVAHYAGRAALDIRSGIAATVVAAGLLIETGITILAGGSIALLGWLLLPDMRVRISEALPRDPGILWLLLAVLAVLAVLGALAMLMRKWKRLEDPPQITLHRLLRAFPIYIVAFVLLGLSFHLIVGLTSSEPGVSLLLSTAVFAVGWILGFATPGAPGGLGIRETVVTLGLAPIIGGPAALSAALIHRAANVLGDGVAFGIGMLIPTADRADS